MLSQPCFRCDFLSANRMSSNQEHTIPERLILIAASQGARHTRFVTRIVNVPLFNHLAQPTSHRGIGHQFAHGLACSLAIFRIGPCSSYLRAKPCPLIWVSGDSRSVNCSGFLCSYQPELTRQAVA